MAPAKNCREQQGTAGIAPQHAQVMHPAGIDAFQHQSNTLCFCQGSNCLRASCNHPSQHSYQNIPPKSAKVSPCWKHHACIGRRPANRPRQQRQAKACRLLTNPRGSQQARCVHSKGGFDPTDSPCLRASQRQGRCMSYIQATQEPGVVGTLRMCTCGATDGQRMPGSMSTTKHLKQYAAEWAGSAHPTAINPC